MKKVWLPFLLIGAISSLPVILRAWPRLGSAANIVTQNSGDKTAGISVTIDGISAVQVYSTNPKHREILLQNTDSTYYVYCATYSAITATSGFRWLLPPKPAALTTNANSSIYCIADPAASSIEILGSIEFDSKDVP